MLSVGFGKYFTLSFSLLKVFLFHISSLNTKAKQSGEKIKIPVKVSLFAITKTPPTTPLTLFLFQPKPIPKISEICKGRLNRKELRTLFHHFDGLRSPGKTFVQKEVGVFSSFFLSFFFFIIPFFFLETLFPSLTHPKEFSKKLGFILNESGLSNQMFDRLNESRSGKLTFLEFVQGMSVMMKVRKWGDWIGERLSFFILFYYYYFLFYFILFIYLF